MAIEPSMSYPPSPSPSPSARMQEGVLILSLPSAIEPVLWKIDIVHYRNLTLRVTRSQSDNSEIFSLVSNIDNDFSDHVVANFTTKDAALKAMMMAQDALEHMRPASLIPSEKLISAPNPWIKYILKPISFIILSILIFVILLYGSYGVLMYFKGDKAMAPRTTGESGAAESGQSMSAEDFLKDR